MCHTYCAVCVYSYHLTKAHLLHTICFKVLFRQWIYYHKYHFRIYILSLIYSVTQSIVENKKPFNGIRFGSRFFLVVVVVLRLWPRRFIIRSTLKLFKTNLMNALLPFFYLQQQVSNIVIHNTILVRINKCHSQVCALKFYTINV